MLIVRNPCRRQRSILDCTATTEEEGAGGGGGGDDDDDDGKDDLTNTSTVYITY